MIRSINPLIKSNQLYSEILTSCPSLLCRRMFRRKQPPPHISWRTWTLSSRRRIRRNIRRAPCAPRPIRSAIRTSPGPCRIPSGTVSGTVPRAWSRACRCAPRTIICWSPTDCTYHHRRPPPPWWSRVATYPHHRQRRQQMDRTLIWATNICPIRRW